MKSVSTQYSVVRKLLFISIFPVLLTSCLWRSPVEVVLLEKTTTLTEKPLIIKCIPPLYRSRDGAGIYFAFSGKWNRIHRTINGKDRGGVELENGKVVFLKVALIDDAGKRYVNDSANLSGDIKIGFALPANVKIVKVEITSSIEVECNKIYWYCSDQI